MKLEKNNYKETLPELQMLIARGDEGAFELLYSFYKEKLFAFALGYLKSSELAEEVIEDVFVKLWCKRECLTDIQNLNVYLYSATKNHCLNALSKESRRPLTSSLDSVETERDPAENSPHDLFVTSEIMQSMRKVVEELPPRCKMIFRLVREDGLPYKEVAEILNISVNTIDAQMAIAVRRICASMGISKVKKAAR